MHQQRNVVQPLPERRSLQRNNIEAVVEVAAEPPGRYFGLQILIGRGNDPHINLNDVLTANPLEFLLLDDP